MVWCSPGLLSAMIAWAMLILTGPGVTRGQGRTDTQHQLSDGLPVPLSGMHASVFTSRVIRWHEDYCGKSRLCRETNLSPTPGCYRCAPCRCDIHCHAFGDCCPDVALKDMAANQLSRADRVFQASLTCDSSEIQLFLPGSASVTSSQRTHSLDSTYERYGQRQRLNQRPAVTGSPAYIRQGDRSQGGGTSGGERRRGGIDRDAAIPKFFMISRCPNTFTRDSSECQYGGVLSPVSPAGYNGAGISRTDPPAVYRNIHCARCHGVFDTVPWNIRVICSRMKNLPSFATPRNLTLTLALDPDCAVTFTPPPAPHHHSRPCYTRPEMISSCNVTGAWRKRDSFLERACLSYLTPKSVAGRLYQNVFCFLCNHGDQDASIQFTLTSCQRNPSLALSSGGGDGLSQTRAGLPLSVTLTHFDITKELSRAVLFEGPTDKMCQDWELYDFKQKSCRAVFCSLGQKLVLGRCEPMFLSLSGVAYELYFGLGSDQPIDLSGDNDLLHHLPTEMETYLSQVMLRDTVRIQDFAMAFNTTDGAGQCGHVSQHLALYARLVNLTSPDQATLQRQLLHLRRARFTLHMGRWTMGFQAYPSETAWHSMHPSRRQSPQTLSACVIIVSNSHLEQTREGTRRVGSTTPDPATIHDPPTPLIRISSLLECPQVALLPEEFTVPPRGPGDDLHLKWDRAGNLTENNYLMTIEGNVSICLEDFLGKLGFDRSKRSDAEKIVVSVLLPISIMCLLATLSVFLAFSPLRTLPGKTNIIFVACLLCSQAALFLVYLENDVRTRGCAVKGALAHYFGLSVVVAQAACSYHVYTAFTTMHLSSVLKREGKLLLVYCAVTFVLPLLIVGAVVALNVFPSAALSPRSPGDSSASSINTARPGSASTFGYGGGALCLLSTPLAVWVSLLLPVVVFLAADMALFALTYTSLKHTIKDLETSSRDVRHVHFYFRVSLITSLAWILAIVGHVTTLPVFRIVFVVVYCFVGCYTFFTLVLTRQVTRLVTGCCCGSRRPPMGRTSLNLKMVPATECQARNPCIVATGFKPTGSARSATRRGARGSGRDPILGESKAADGLKPEEIDYRASGEYEPYFFNQDGNTHGVKFAETIH